MDAPTHDSTSETLPADLKRIRKGTRSCVECRQRKIRCLWDHPDDNACTSCVARGRDCVPQLYTRRVANTSKVSSKDRIARLEAQLANITATTHGANDATFGQFDPAGGSSAPVFDDQGSDTDDPTIHEGPAALPEHLRFLFDNALIGPDERIQHREDDEEARGQVCSTRYADAARARLQRLMPSRDDVAAVSSYAITWMSFYYELFPSPSVTPQRGHMIDKYAHMLEPDADIVHIASFLLTFALTARQLPQGGNGLILNGWKDVHSYVKAVMATVDAVIISHAGIAATIEGASVSVLFLRLQLGLGRVRSLWLTLRRTVALAEIAGLPRAWYSAHYLRTRTSGAPDSLTPGSADGVYLCESICATDRMASMMFNLPAATTAYKFPRKQIVDADGSVRAQSYMFEEAGIAMRISELDDGYMHRGPEDAAYQKVLECDRELRSLKSLTPSSWWQEEAEFLSGAMLVQFWHYYLAVRIHLHAAMANDAHDQYAYSRATCLDACLSVARRYSYLRRALPAGFFVCRIVDMQVFTAAIYLVLSSHEHDPIPSEEESTYSLSCVEHVITTMDHVSAGQIGNEFPLAAAATLRALITHLNLPKSAHAPAVTLRIPLLGRVHVGRRVQNSACASSSSSGGSSSTTMTNPSDMTPHPNTVTPGGSHSQSAAADPTGSTDPTITATATAPAAPTNLNAYDPTTTTTTTTTTTAAPYYEPWMQLDINTSFQDPFFAEEDMGGDFIDPWMVRMTDNDETMMSIMMGGSGGGGGGGGDGGGGSSGDVDIFGNTMR